MISLFSLIDFVHYSQWKEILKRDFKKQHRINNFTMLAYITNVGLYNYSYGVGNMCKKGLETCFGSVSLGLSNRKLSIHMIFFIVNLFLMTEGMTSK